MAVMRRIGALAEMLLKQRLASQQQDKISQQGFQQQAALRAASDPGYAVKLRDSGITNIGGLPIDAPDNKDAFAGLSKRIAETTDPQKLMDPLSIINDYRNQPGVSYDPSSMPDIQSLITQTNQRREAIQNNAPLVKQQYIKDGLLAERYVNPYHAEDVRTEQSGQEKGQQIQAEKLAGELSGPVSAAKAKQEGQVTGAREAAQFPYQVKLAQQRADTSLLNQQAMDDYRKAHPATPQALITRQHTAMTAQSLGQDINTLLDEMDKQGMMGPIASRAADLSAGTIKAQDLFTDPQQAKLAAQYFSSIKLLQSLAANAHYGQRGAGSVGGQKHFEQVLSGIGDTSIVKGQLYTLDRLMSSYAQDPTQPFAVPEEVSVPTQQPTSPILPSAQDKLRQRGLLQ